MKREFAEDNKPQPQVAAMFSKFPHPAAAAEAEAEPDSPAFLHRSGDGATIEVVRRPRGRPPGSKNKPKPPVIIPSEPTMTPYVLELPGGVDVVESTHRFCRKRNIGLCVLSGNGAVANVTLKQPSSTPGATVTFHGRFDVLSISAAILPPGGPAAGGGPFAITLAGPQGQVVGGHVVGPLVSAGTVYLIAANFSNPSFHRLQQVDDDREEEGGGGESPNKTASGRSGAAASGGPVYSYQASDVIWAPTTARQPQQPPPPPY